MSLRINDVAPNFCRRRALSMKISSVSEYSLIVPTSLPWSPFFLVPLAW